ncbi:MarR family winged helix-turn-helix transcriptional regulator [Caldimonas caldifontis]|uniref:MarR family winged helix-turn-helix transcriptional regulator n=1 Tax=Caldimonas caldifontis TaxID=1452508 RepID=UPI001FE76B0D|nr:MarR family winged helix-turn-helix transcriptional regulator [Caldimonas caldifontis]
MAKKGTVKLLPRETVLHVRDTCLCLAAQRAARRLARHFDQALKPTGLTNGQFSLLMALNQPDPPPMGQLAEFLAMEPSTLSAAAKVLERRGLITMERDPIDGRSKRLRISSSGVALMREAVGIWRQSHALLEAQLPPGAGQALREGLAELTTAALSGETVASHSSGS